MSNSLNKLISSNANVARDLIYDKSSILSKNPLHYGMHNGQEVDIVARHAVL